MKMKSIFNQPNYFANINLYFEFEKKVQTLESVHPMIPKYRQAFY